MSDLRDHLFATLEALRDEEKPMDINRAKAVSEVASTIIDAAKVEVEFMRARRAMYGDEVAPEAPSSFFELPPPAVPERPANRENGHRPALLGGIR
jgi:hypothetical protein